MDRMNAKMSGKRVNTQIVFLGIIIVALTIVVAIINPRFISAQNITNLFKQISVTGICSIGMAMVLISGGFDLSIGSLVSLVGCTIGTLINSGVPEMGAILIGILCGTLCGAVNGIIISKSNCAPVIITLGTMGAFKGAALLIAGGNIINFKAPTPLLANDAMLGLPTIIFIFILVVILIFLFFKFTVIGRQIYALGSNQEAAYISGVNIVLTKTLVYKITGLIVAFASIALLMRLGSASAVINSPHVVTSSLTARARFGFLSPMKSVRMFVSASENTIATTSKKLITRVPTPARLCLLSVSC